MLTAHFSKRPRVCVFVRVCLCVSVYQTRTRDPSVLVLPSSYLLLNQFQHSFPTIWRVFDEWEFPTILTLAPSSSSPPFSLKTRAPAQADTEQSWFSHLFTTRARFPISNAPLIPPRDKHACHRALSPSLSSGSRLEHYCQCPLIRWVEWGHI